MTEVETLLGECRDEIKTLKERLDWALTELGKLDAAIILPWTKIKIYTVTPRCHISGDTNICVHWSEALRMAIEVLNHQEIMNHAIEVAISTKTMPYSKIPEDAK